MTFFYEARRMTHGAWRIGRKYTLLHARCALQAGPEVLP